MRLMVLLGMMLRGTEFSGGCGIGHVGEIDDLTWYDVVWEPYRDVWGNPQS